MGAKTWMLVYSDGDAREALGKRPSVDREATLRLAGKLFPEEKLDVLGEGTLAQTCPPDNEIHMGRFPGVAIVAAKEFGIDYPSKLSKHFLEAAPARNVYLHAMHSVVDWFAFAHWVDGKLVRCLSLSPDSGVMEDIGPRMPFEEAYWSGQHPALDPEEKQDCYPFPFHPLELGEAALLALFGYQLEGDADSHATDPASVALLRLKRSRAWWKFWR